VQQDQEFESEDDDRITTVGFVGVGPIDLRSNSSDEMNIVDRGTPEDGTINLGSD